MREFSLILVSLLFVSVAIAACAQPASPEEKVPPSETVAPEPALPPQPADSQAVFAITSPVFVAGAKIPVEYTCDGQNSSPPLEWSQGQTGTASFALIVDDPDAPSGAFTHWVIFNLPPDTRSLPEAVPNENKLPSGALQGENGFGKIGYAGPCPPTGSPHHYRFILYALDKSLDLAAGASKEQALRAMQGHVLSESQLIGVYQR
jgi:Raf kinase inhibitor-like YbhB/YbcL family protein